MSDISTKEDDRLTEYSRTANIPVHSIHRAISHARYRTDGEIGERERERERERGRERERERGGERERGEVDSLRRRNAILWHERWREKKRN